MSTPTPTPQPIVKKPTVSSDMPFANKPLTAGLVLDYSNTSFTNSELGQLGPKRWIKEIMLKDKGIPFKAPQYDVDSVRTMKQFNQWADEGLIIPTEDQGTCGSCWAHALCNVLGSRLKIQYNDFGINYNVPLSSAYLTACLFQRLDFIDRNRLTQRVQSKEGSQDLSKLFEPSPNNPCDGAVILNVYKQMEVHTEGTFMLYDFPFINRYISRSAFFNKDVYGEPVNGCLENKERDPEAGCKVCDVDTQPKIGKTTGGFSVSTCVPCDIDTMPSRGYDPNKYTFSKVHYFYVCKDDECRNQDVIDIVKFTIANFGPVPAGILCTDDIYSARMSNPDTVYPFSANKTVIGGHTITVVGWDETGPEPFWICQNSWGENYGYHNPDSDIGGFFNVSRKNPLPAIQFVIFSQALVIRGGEGVPELLDGSDFQTYPDEFQQDLRLYPDATSSAPWYITYWWAIAVIIVVALLFLFRRFAA